jgi:hypothetical protein
MNAKRLHRTEHGFHYDNKVRRLLATKVNQRNGETKLKMKNPVRKKKCTMQTATTKPKESEATA